MSRAECDRLVALLFFSLIAIVSAMGEAEGRAFVRSAVVMARFAWGELGTGSIELVRALSTRLRETAPRRGLGSKSWPHVAYGLDAIAWLLGGHIAEARFVFPDLYELEEDAKGIDGLDEIAPKFRRGEEDPCGPIECERRMRAALDAGGLGSFEAKSGALLGLFYKLQLEDARGARVAAFKSFLSGVSSTCACLFPDIPGQIAHAVSRAEADALARRCAEEQQEIARRAAEAS